MDHHHQKYASSSTAPLSKDFRRRTAADINYPGHRPTYEKYSGYNGWDDDAIDNAFEGDPDATWNVD